MNTFPPFGEARPYGRQDRFKAGEVTIKYYFLIEKRQIFVDLG
ncbi:MAG: hypothetical protein QME51_02375 [Planctomycetota bacterium]|nr:hypothetical protein [Planctomycetota bacterium]